MTEPLILTLDIGTSSARALLWDAQGRQVEDVKAQTPYRMHTTPDGGVELPPEELLAHVAGCLDQATAQMGDRAASLRAVGVTTFWHSLIGLDAGGEPITPLYSWADTRSGSFARRLRQTLDADAIHARTGCVLHASYYPAKLAWLRATQPEVYHRAAQWVSPSEYLAGALFGPEARRVSVSMASGTGLLNQARCQWDAETLDALGLPVERLSPLVDLREPAQGLLGAFAARWPALRAAPFFPAVGDGAASNVGSGCIAPGRFAINLGTSGAIRAVWDERAPDAPSDLVTPPGLWRYRVDRQRAAIGAAFSDGGHVAAWMLKTLRLPPEAELFPRLAAMEPGAHGLAFLPFLAGERSMGWNADAKAALTGLALDTDPVEITRAAMEAVAMRFALAARALGSVFPGPKQIIASGGAFAHLPFWAQMFADALGQPVTLAEEAEASSRGAALLAAEAAGLLPDIADADVRLGATFAPNPAHHARYAEMLARQQELYAKLIA